MTINIDKCFVVRSFPGTAAVSSSSHRRTFSNLPNFLAISVSSPLNISKGSTEVKRSLIAGSENHFSMRSSMQHLFSSIVLGVTIFQCFSRIKEYMCCHRLCRDHISVKISQENDPAHSSSPRCPFNTVSAPTRRQRHLSLPDYDNTNDTRRKSPRRSHLYCDSIVSADQKNIRKEKYARDHEEDWYCIQCGLHFHEIHKCPRER